MCGFKTRYRWGYRTLMVEVSDSIHLRRSCRIALSERVPCESTVRKLTTFRGTPGHHPDGSKPYRNGTMIDQRTTLGSAGGADDLAKLAIAVEADITRSRAADSSPRPSLMQSEPAATLAHA